MSQGAGIKAREDPARARPVCSCLLLHSARTALSDHVAMERGHMTPFAPSGAAMRASHEDGRQTFTLETERTTT